MSTTEKRQLNLSLSEDEWKQIDGMARKLGIDKKELIVKSLKGYKESEQMRKEHDPRVTEDVHECIDAAEGLFGFRMDTLIKEFENRGLTWSDLGEFNQLAILIRYRDHARFWHYSGEQIRQELGELAERVGTDVNPLLRTYHTTLSKKNTTPTGSTVRSVIPPIVRKGADHVAPAVSETPLEESERSEEQDTKDERDEPDQVNRDEGDTRPGEVQEAP
jgi:hypothetical protein